PLRRALSERRALPRAVARAAEEKTSDRLFRRRLQRLRQLRGVLPRRRRAELDEAAHLRRRPRRAAAGRDRRARRRLRSVPHQLPERGERMTVLTPMFESLVLLRGRSMLLTSEWSRDELAAVCDLAQLFEMLDRTGRGTHLLPNELHYGLFFDNSTRTKSSWAGAAARLGAHPMV